MAKRKASASVDLVRVLVKYAAALGVDLDAVWQVVGLDPARLETGEGRVPIERFNALWRGIASQAGDPDFGLHLAEASAGLPGSHLLLSVMMNCPTVGSAMEKLCRYHDLSTDFVRLRLRQGGDHAYLAWEPVSAGIPLQRHHSEAVLCGLALTLRRLVEGEIRFVEIRFTHPQPADITEHQRILGCPLAFGRPQNELVMRREDLDLPIFLANAELLEALERFAQEMLQRVAPPESWSEQVTDQLRRAMLRGERPMLASVASALASSPRHLQNKLREEGTTYRALLDALRRETALRYLEKPQMPIVDVAFLLGFSEQSAFNHAFKRWTGTSPQKYRFEQEIASSLESDARSSQ